jgi:mRNA-degrading endonuclease toxin of MazEF toxin-antitoxin module
MARIPHRGDLYHLDLEPVKGKEQRVSRYVFVLSPAAHNRQGPVIALPVSQGVTLARSAGFICTLMGAGLKTQGAIICNQPRVLDFMARAARYVETAPDDVIEDVLIRVAPLVT